MTGRQAAKLRDKAHIFTGWCSEFNHRAVNTWTPCLDYAPFQVNHRSCGLRSPGPSALLAIDGDKTAGQQEKSDQTEQQTNEQKRSWFPITLFV